MSNDSPTDGTPNDQTPEGNWLEQALQGSPEARAKVLEGFRPYLLAIANAELDPQLQAKGGASDLVQQTLLEAHQALGQFELRGQEQLLGWLRQILLHNLADFRRRFGPHAKGDADPGREARLDDDSNRQLLKVITTGTPPPIDKAIQAEQEEALRRGLADLPDDQHTATMLRFQEGLSWADIGARMNRSAEAARRLAFRAIERLKRAMNPQE